MVSTFGTQSFDFRSAKIEHIFIFILTMSFQIGLLTEIDNDYHFDNQMSDGESFFFFIFHKCICLVLGITTGISEYASIHIH